MSGIFTLSDTLKDAIRYRLPGPGKDGAPALLIASDGRGRFEQLVVNTPGPAELWALTTSRPTWRCAVVSRPGWRLPRLGTSWRGRFPTGSARASIDAGLGHLAAAGARSTEEDVLDRISDELVRTAENDRTESTI